MKHGKDEGKKKTPIDETILVPSAQKKHLKITDHPFFGMSSQDTDKAVLDELNDLRKTRSDDI